jgi:flagellin-like hook-associated protein FlgL
MAINDVSLTSGMRSNLLALQNTVDLLDRTQSRLATGKKVNTAIDNPVSFFAAQSLTSRASIIDGLKDAMGQAVQTITAADKGITAISAMIEQAKGLAQSALSAAPGTTPPSVTGTATNDITYANATVTLTAGGMTNIGDTIAFGGVTFAVNTDAGGAISFDGTAEGLATAIAANVTGATAVDADDVVTVSMADADVAGDDFTITVGTPGDAVAADGPIEHSEVMSVTAGGVTYTGAAGEDTATARANLQTAIRDTEGVAATSTVSAENVVTVNFDAEASEELTSLQGQYNTLLTQLTALAEDSGYKGKNLLSANTLTVKFEGINLDVKGFDASASGLKIGEATWVDGGNIDTSLKALDDALVTLRSESSKLSGNLSIITVRQDFSTNMINTLTQGADKLTLADANEEGANMLMLQTRQSLSTTALSMSAQAAQSVLRLFQ